jgi:hypothetical protein
MNSHLVNSMPVVTANKKMSRMTNINIVSMILHHKTRQEKMIPSMRNKHHKNLISKFSK